MKRTVPNFRLLEAAEQSHAALMRVGSTRLFNLRGKNFDPQRTIPWSTSPAPHTEQAAWGRGMKSGTPHVEAHQNLLVAAASSPAHLEENLQVWSFNLWGKHVNSVREKKRCAWLDFWLPPTGRPCITILFLYKSEHLLTKSFNSSPFKKVIIRNRSINLLHLILRWRFWSETSWASNSYK